MFWRKSDFCTFESLLTAKKLPLWQMEEIALVKDSDVINQKLNLILKELGKEYVPESSKTEPAKLVSRRSIQLPEGWGTLCGGGDSIFDGKEITQKPKKKRGRPKKK